MAEARALAERYPDVVLSIDHAGYPHRRDAVYFARWRKGMEVRPRLDGGQLATVGARLHRAVRRGAQLLRHDWPVDRLYSSYGDVLDAYEELVAGLTPDEQTALFSTNAERIFRI